MSAIDSLRTRLRPEPRPLAGRVVLITGGARGLGLATARRLAARGCRVAIGDLDADLAAAEASALPAPGPHHAGRLDVTDPDGFAAFVEEVERELGPLDVMINNAGIMPIGPFVEEDPATSRRQVEINLMGVITGTRLALQRFQPRGSGHVVNIASIAGKTGVAGEAVYCATKHAVVGFDEALRLELLGTGVEITTVMPGLANTELAAGMQAGRGVDMIEPEDVAAAIESALERPRLNVFVPAKLDAITRSRSLMPRAVEERVLRLFDADKVGLQYDAAGRAAYEQRYERPVAAEAERKAEQV